MFLKIYTQIILRSEFLLEMWIPLMAFLLEDIQFDYRKLKDTKHLLEHMKEFRLPSKLTISLCSS